MKAVNKYKSNKESGILLNANELYINLNEKLLPEIQEVISTILFNRYPDDSTEGLRERYAYIHNLHKDEILVGNGSDSILGLVIGIFLGKGKKLYTLSPDFQMYEYYSSMHDGEVVTYRTNKDGSFKVEEFIEKGKNENPSLIILSNPNNPTGYFARNKELEKILEVFTDVPVIIDEAYGEYSSESMIENIRKYKNLYITRTLSKAYGLANARVGFLISQKDNISFIADRKAPFTVNGISQAIACIVLKHVEDFKAAIAETKSERDALYDECKNGIGYKIYPSSGNFIFGRSENKEELLRKFKEDNIIIRSFDDDSFRITIGSSSENEKVKNILINFRGKTND